MPRTISRMNGYDESGRAVIEEVLVHESAFEARNRLMDELFPAPLIICDACGKVTQGQEFFEITIMGAHEERESSSRACSVVCARLALRDVARRTR